MTQKEEGIQTFMSCQHHQEMTERGGVRSFVERQGIYDTHHCNFKSHGKKLPLSMSGCSNNRNDKKCPVGFQ